MPINGFYYEMLFGPTQSDLHSTFECRMGGGPQCARCSRPSDVSLEGYTNPKQILLYDRSAVKHSMEL